MASSTPFDGTSFLTGAPDEDQPHGNDYQEHQSTRKSMEFVNNKEHDAIATDPSVADGGGEHKLGSAKIYHGDYSTASAGDNLPTLRPDGVTALDSSDAGRRAFDTDATFGGKYYRWSGSAWVIDAVTLDTDTDLSGKSWFLDEDDMASDDATKVSSQQAIKTFVESSVPGLESVQVYCEVTSSGALVGGSNNVASVNHTGTGEYTINLTNSFANANFTTIVSLTTVAGFVLSNSDSLSTITVRTFNSSIVATDRAFSMIAAGSV